MKESYNIAVSSSHTLAPLVGTYEMVQRFNLSSQLGLPDLCPGLDSVNREQCRGQVTRSIVMKPLSVPKTRNSSGLTILECQGLLRVQCLLCDIALGK